MIFSRRGLLASAAAFAAVPALARAADAPTLDQVFDRIFAARLDASPEEATGRGLDIGPRAAARALLDDRSVAGRERSGRDQALWLSWLQAVDASALPPRQRLQHDAIAYGLDVQARAARAFPAVAGPGSPYVVSQLGGAAQAIPDFLESQHPVADRADAEAYLARLSAFATALDQEGETLRHDVAGGTTPPDFVLDTTLRQLRALRDPAPADTRMVRSVAERAAAANIPGDWAARAEAIVRADVAPALDRQAALVEDLRRTAGSDAGVWKLKDGDAYYAASLEAWTTTDVSADEIHRTGLELVADIRAQADAALRGLGYTQGGVGDRMKAMAKDSRRLHPNTDAGRQALMAEVRGIVDDMTARLPERFGRLPRTALQVLPVPEAIQAGRSRGYYQWPAMDGSRPGMYFINLRDTSALPRWHLKTLTYHEAVPGHHMQLSLQTEAGLPDLMKATGFNAYIEGWGLYAEQLADEMGLYEDDPAGRVGYLFFALYRALRLVVDTGLHAKRWSRDQALAYYQDLLGDEESSARSEIDRYCVWPGQACTYMLGKLSWLKARERLMARDGAAFDIRAFHDRALAAGSLPLAVFERAMEA